MKKHSIITRMSQDGFTIIELIMGLGIFAFIAVSVFLVYNNAIKVDRMSSRLSELSHEAYWTLVTLEEDLQRAVPYQYQDDLQNHSVPFFTGDARSLSFLAETPNGLQFVSYDLNSPEAEQTIETRLGEHYTKNEATVISELNETEGLFTLVRRSSQFQGRPIVLSPDLPAEILSQRITSDGLQFAYGKKLSNSGKPEFEWLTKWTDPEPPDAVRIALKVIDGSTRFELTDDIALPAKGFKAQSEAENLNADFGTPSRNSTSTPKNEPAPETSTVTSQADELNKMFNRDPVTTPAASNPTPGPVKSNINPSNPYIQDGYIINMDQ